MSLVQGPQGRVFSEFKWKRTEKAQKKNTTKPCLSLNGMHASGDGGAALGTAPGGLGHPPFGYSFPAAAQPTGPDALPACQVSEAVLMPHGSRDWRQQREHPAPVCPHMSGLVEGYSGQVREGVLRPLMREGSLAD